MYGCCDVSNATTTTPQYSTSVLGMPMTENPLIVVIPITIIVKIFFIFFLRMSIPIVNSIIRIH